jgi:RimJ/RimL family protein N-acetyltransferase
MNDAAPPTSVPRIETPRLLLRGYRASDFEAYAENFADPLATVHTSGVLDRRAAWRAFAAGMGFWMLHGAGWWGIALRETGELVGVVGAFYRETSPALEIGWAIYRRFWRRGFASEAAAAALDFCFDRHQAKRVTAYISPTNLASIAVGQRIGMRHEADVELYGEPVGLYVAER